MLPLIVNYYQIYSVRACSREKKWGVNRERFTCISEKKVQICRPVLWFFFVHFITYHCQIARIWIGKYTHLLTSLPAYYTNQHVPKWCPSLAFSMIHSSNVVFKWTQRELKATSTWFVLTVFLLLWLLQGLFVFAAKMQFSCPQPVAGPLSLNNCHCYQVLTTNIRGYYALPAQYPYLRM